MNPSIRRCHSGKRHQPSSTTPTPSSPQAPLVEWSRQWIKIDASDVMISSFVSFEGFFPYRETLIVIINGRRVEEVYHGGILVSAGWQNLLWGAKRRIWERGGCPYYYFHADGADARCCSHCEMKLLPCWTCCSWVPRVSVSPQT